MATSNGSLHVSDFEETAETTVPKNPQGSDDPEDQNRQRSRNASRNRVILQSEKILTSVLIVLVLYSAVWALTGHLMLPGGYLLTIFFVYVLATVAGKCVTHLHMPALVGMLLAGMMSRAFVEGTGSMMGEPPSELTSNLRHVAFAVILVRAGLGLDMKSILKQKRAVVLLACVPGCVVEAQVVAAAAYLLLGFPYIWGLILGFTLAAVSPAVVVPSLLALQELGYGVDQGVPSVVIAAASLDDILAICCFSVALGICFSTGITAILIKTPLEIFFGLLCGILLGLLLWVVPPSPASTVAASKTVSVKRFIILLGLALFLLIGSGRLHFGGAGALAVLSCAFVAGYRWGVQERVSKQKVELWFRHSWNLCMPFLFGLIGYEIQLSSVYGNRTVWALVVILAGLLFRMAVSVLCACGPELTWREQLFIAIAWMPKATVQAAIGAVPLDLARKEAQDSDLYLSYGSDVLTTAVLSILFTAPIGAIAVAFAGRRLLRKSSVDDVQMASLQLEPQDQRNSPPEIET